ncbi:MAG: EamA family transporter [Desulfobulbaceae bacterium]|nr:EamA family transporter [Desulfobulbaceae bacterium]
MAVLLMFCASACFVTMSALVKAMGESLPLIELMFLRSVIAVPFLLILLLRKQKPLIATAWKIMLLRTLFGTLAMFSFYYALTHMPLAECVFIGRTQPIILSLLAPLLVGETAPRTAWIAILLGLAGAVIIMQPNVAWSPAAGVALLAAATSAVAHLLVRRLNRTENPSVIVFNFTLLMSMISGIITIPSFQMPSAMQWIFLMFIAGFASLGQYLMTLAYSMDKAPVVAAASYASVLLSVVYGYFFWNEIPTLAGWIGGALVVGGGMYLMISRWHGSEPARSL